MLRLSIWKCTFHPWTHCCHATAEAATRQSLINSDFLTWRMPFSPNMQKPTFYFDFFFPLFTLHKILNGGWAEVRERLHSHPHHHNCNLEWQVCSWLHICGGGIVLLGSHEYFWLSWVGDTPHWFNLQEISHFIDSIFWNTSRSPKSCSLGTCNAALSLWGSLSACAFSFFFYQEEWEDFRNLAPYCLNSVNASWNSLYSV